MSYAVENMNETGTEETGDRVEIDRFERSPKLAELTVAYRSRTKVRQRHEIRDPKDVEQYLRAIWDRRRLDLVEEFVVVCLNGNHQALGWVKVASGGFNAAPVDPRLIFAIALKTASSAIILAHNHPSGSLEPSGQDREVTRRLKEAGKLLGIAVLDHIILTREAAYSFEGGIL
jgi:DNA repair protein RadC